MPTSLRILTPRIRVDLQGGPGGLWPTLRLGEKLFRVVFLAHRRKPAPTGAVELLLPAASREPCRPASCLCSAASHLPPVGRRRPPLGRLGAFPAPAATCQPPASATQPTLPVRLRPPVPQCWAVGLGHQPTLPSGPSGSLMVRPPCSARHGGASGLPPSLLGAVSPPSLAAASLAPCSAAPCSMPSCSAASRAGVPRCRAPATLPSGPVAPPYSTGSIAPLAQVLCATVGLPGIVFAS
jgi:hypothetical protein